jgi:hypothetical protein
MDEKITGGSARSFSDPTSVLRRREEAAGIKTMARNIPFPPESGNVTGRELSDLRQKAAAYDKLIIPIVNSVLSDKQLQAAFQTTNAKILALHSSLAAISSWMKIIVETLAKSGIESLSRDSIEKIAQELIASESATTVTSASSGVSGIS